MSTENPIEKLFDDENLESPPSDTQHLDLSAQAPKPSEGIERRQFTRIDVQERKFELKFSHGLQFARQYIDNISLGGLFVKTDLKPPLGTIMPIQFQVPTKDGGVQIFDLVAKVCRVTAEGTGVEFTNLDQPTRLRLEEFIRSILPAGLAVTPPPKRSMVETLSRLRDERRERQLHRRRLAFRLAFIVALFALNWITFQELQKTPPSWSKQRSQEVQIAHRTVELGKISSIAKLKHGDFELKLVSGERITVRENQLTGTLPYSLQQTVNLLRSMPTFEPKRKSKTAPNRVQLR